MKRLAILHSDGSMSVLRDFTSVEQARKELTVANLNERRPKHLSTISWVEIEVCEAVT